MPNIPEMGRFWTAVGSALQAGHQWTSPRSGRSPRSRREHAQTLIPQGL